MKRVRFYFICLLLIFSTVNSALSQTKTGRPAIFKLETEATVMYFFGSVHLGSPDMFPLPEETEKAYALSEHLVVEANILELDTSGLISLFREKLMYAKGTSLDDFLSPVEREKLSLLMQEYGLSYKMFKIFKPVVIDLLLTQQIAKALGYEAESGIDLYFLNKTAETGKKVLELEGLTEQIEAMSRIPEDVQVLMLAGSLDNLDETEKELALLVLAWKTGDLETCHALSESQYRENPALMPVYTILVSERNKKMAQRLEEMIKKGGTYFVVIGAGHFIGPGSVIELLKAQGYQVSRQE